MDALIDRSVQARVNRHGTDQKQKFRGSLEAVIKEVVLRAHETSTSEIEKNIAQVLKKAGDWLSKKQSIPNVRSRRNVVTTRTPPLSKDSDDTEILSDTE